MSLATARAELAKKRSAPSATSTVKRLRTARASIDARLAKAVARVAAKKAAAKAKLDARHARERQALENKFTTATNIATAARRASAVRAGADEPFARAPKKAAKKATKKTAKKATKKTAKKATKKAPKKAAKKKAAKKAAKKSKDPAPGRLYIFNTTIAPTPGLVYATEVVSLQRARALTRAAAKSGRLVSAVGHSATAELATQLLKVPVPECRIAAGMAAGDQAVCLKLRGRLPEGQVLSRAELDRIGYDFVLMTASAPAPRTAKPTQIPLLGEARA